MCMDAKAMPANDINYSCHRTYLTNHMGSTSHCIMALVINSPGGGHIRGQSNSKKPGMPAATSTCQLRPAHAWFKNNQSSVYLKIKNKDQSSGTGYFLLSHKFNS